MGGHCDTRLPRSPASVATCIQLPSPNVLQHVQNLRRQVRVLHVELGEVGLQQGGRGLLWLQGRVLLLETQDPAGGDRALEQSPRRRPRPCPRGGSPITSWPRTAPWSSSSPAAGGQPRSPQACWGACSPAEGPSHNPEAGSSPRPAQDTGNSLGAVDNDHPTPHPHSQPSARPRAPVTPPG